MREGNPRVKTLAPHGRVKALVVDDEEMNRVLLTDALEAIGVEVRQAANGKQAMEQIGREEPDIVFLDMRMPVMDGMETLHNINERYGYRHFHIIGTSASDSPLQQNEFLQTGCISLMSKPFRLNQVFDCIGQLPGVELEYQDEAAEIGSTDGAIDYASIRVPAEQFLAVKDAVEQADASGVATLLSSLQLEGDVEDRLAAQLAALSRENNLEPILTTLEKCLIAGIGHD